MNDLYDCEVYEFTPEITGEYILTAVGTNGVKAALYNSNFQKISSSDTGDDYVSFRITHDMTANEKYYIVVEQKSAATESTIYELYVEEPFEIVLIAFRVLRRIKYLQQYLIIMLMQILLITKT